MSRSILRVRALAVGVGVFVVAAAAAGGTLAASNPATLYACYDAYGNVRLADIAQCKLPGGGRLVSWSTAGVPGPTGAAGPAGSTGPTGPTGPAGTGLVAIREVGGLGSNEIHVVTLPGDVTVMIACRQIVLLGTDAHLWTAAGDSSGLPGPTAAIIVPAMVLTAVTGTATRSGGGPLLVQGAMTEGLGDAPCVYDFTFQY